jgi:hypothetical protein
MSRTRRALAPLVLATVLALAGCSGDSGSGASGDSGDGGEGSGSTEVSALGLAFDVPAGWETLDPEDAEIPEEEAADLAEGLNLTPEQFDQTVRGVDLFVVDGDGPQDGFLSNINVLGQPGTLPPDGQLEQQFGAIGAEVVDISREDTDAGEVVAVQYSLGMQDNTVEGVSYLLAQDEEVVTVTVSTPDRAQSDEIGEGILASLTEAS